MNKNTETKESKKNTLKNFVVDNCAGILICGFGALCAAGGAFYGINLYKAQMPYRRVSGNKGCDIVTGFADEAGKFLVRITNNNSNEALGILLELDDAKDLLTKSLANLEEVMTDNK